MCEYISILPKLKISGEYHNLWLAMISESKDIFHYSQDYDLGNKSFGARGQLGEAEVADEIKRFNNSYEFNYRNIPMILSFFDTRKGPRILLAESEALNVIKRVPKHEGFLTTLMDIHQTGEFFIHHFEGIMSVNYCFSVDDDKARGGFQLFMLSLIVDSIENQVEVLKRIQFFNHYLKFLSKRMNRSILIKKIYDEYSENMRAMNADKNRDIFKGIKAGMNSSLDSNLTSETLRSLFKN